MSVSLFDPRNLHVPEKVTFQYKRGLHGCFWVSCKQWWIQDFLRAQLQRWGANLLLGQLSSDNYMKMMKKIDRRGRRGEPPPPPGSANVKSQRSRKLRLLDIADIKLQTPLNFVFDATQTCNTVIRTNTHIRGANFRLHFPVFRVQILVLCFSFLFRTLSVLCSSACLSMVSIFLFRSTCFFLFYRKFTISLFVYVSIRALPYQFQFHIFVSPPIGHSGKLKQKESD